MQVDSNHSQTNTVGLSKEPTGQTSELPQEDWQSKVSKKRKRVVIRSPKSGSFLNQSRARSSTLLRTTTIALLDLNIPKRSGLMTERELSITEDYTVSALLEALASSKLSAHEVTLAFSKRAAIAGS